MSKQPLIDKNSLKSLPQNITEARNNLKIALSDFEKVIVHEKIEENERERQARKRTLLHLKALLADLS
ncbi:MAG: hypothetical protein KDD40_10935 [Bdellovibrionales bacterium]|nr:hypothetical protein [Bdellovibrionales bacterium]